MCGILGFPAQKEHQMSQYRRTRPNITSMARSLQFLPQDLVEFRRASDRSARLRRKHYNVVELADLANAALPAFQFKLAQLANNAEPPVPVGTNSLRRAATLDGGRS